MAGVVKLKAWRRHHLRVPEQAPSSQPDVLTGQTGGHRDQLATSPWQDQTMGAPAAVVWLQVRESRSEARILQWKSGPPALSKSEHDRINLWCDKLSRWWPFMTIVFSSFILTASLG